MSRKVYIPRHGGFDPDRMNMQRAQWGGNAIESICDDTGTDREDALSDLLADLMHWAKASQQSFRKELARACRQFAEETSEEG